MIFVLFQLILLGSCEFCNPVPGTPPTKPMGVGFGINPGRVSWYYDRKSCTWDGSKLKFWWKSLDQSGVENMFSKSLLALTSNATEEGAWNSLFNDFNMRKHGQRRGYSVGEKIAIKLNLNVDALLYEPVLNSNSISPQFFKAVIKSLVEKGGVPQEYITAFDASRWFQKQYWNAPYGIGEDYPNVKIKDTKGGEKYCEEVIPDQNTKFYFSDRTVASQNTTLLPKCLTEATYVIEIDAFRGHSLAGITETGKNWFGSIYRPDVKCVFEHLGTSGHWCPASLHKFVNVTGETVNMGGGWLPKRPMGVYNPLVDLLGHDDTAGKGLVFFTDGTYGGVSESEFAYPIKFSMTPFDNYWSCSVFASQDPIALDSVLFDFLRSEKNIENPKLGCTDNYLHEASQLPNPPSKVNYAPSGKTLDSLGVHEHWNNVDDKQYSRNLGTGKGIELIKVHNLKEN